MAFALADEFQYGLLLLSSSVFQSAAAPGRRFPNSPTSQSPVRWLPFSITTYKRKDNVFWRNKLQHLA